MTLNCYSFVTIQEDCNWFSVSIKTKQWNDEQYEKKLSKNYDSCKNAESSRFQ